jgi:hypothetical protein
MGNNIKFVFVPLLLLCFLNIRPVTAVVNDFGEWNFTTINLPLTDKFSLQEVINTRVNEDWSHFGLLFNKKRFGVSPDSARFTLGLDMIGSLILEILPLLMRAEFGNKF